MDTLPTDDQNKTSNYTGVDQKSPEPEPEPEQGQKKEQDDLAKDIAAATTLLDKAEGKNAPPVTIEENIFRDLVESFGYVAEALKDLSAEEQKQLTDVMSKLGPMTTGRPDIQDLVNRYMALQKGGEPSKEPEKPSGQAEQPEEQEKKLSPEELKAALAKFKELLDKSLMREPEGQSPQPAPKPKPKPKKPASGPYLGAGNSPGNVTFGGSMQGPGSTGQWNGRDVDVPAGTFG